MKYRIGESLVTEVQKCRLTGQSQILCARSTIKLMSGWQKIDGIGRQNTVEQQGIWGFKLNCLTELSN